MKIEQKIDNYLKEETKNFSYDDFVEYGKELKNNLDVPFIVTQISTLGGEERSSLIISLSLDAKEDWTNKIFENSRYLKLMANHNGVLELVTQDFNLKPKFRKTKFKNVNDIIKKINAWISKVS